MDWRRYRDAIKRTLPQMNRKDRLSMLALGLGDEAGEVQGIFKKHLYHGHPMDKDHLIEELGDCMWYMEHLMDEYDISPELVRIRNIEKIHKRYPEGFKEEDSINREL